MSRSILLVELGAVVVGLAVLARIASALRFSPIPLYLLAGLAFGEGGLLPLVTSEAFIETGAELGVILLLFMLGLDYSARELTAKLRGGGAVALVDGALNFIPGFIAGLLFEWPAVDSLLLGGVTYVSSSGIVAKLIEDYDWRGQPETPAVLSVLVLEDLVMAAYLPAVAVLLLDVGLLLGLFTIAAALAAVAGFLALSLRFGPAASRLVFSRSDEALVLSILGLTLLVAGAAEALQVSAAVGAFLTGIALSGPAAERAGPLLKPLRDLFGAVFFVFFGLRIDPTDIPAVAAPAIALACIGAATKALTGRFIWRAAGSDGKARWRAGVLLIARGEFSIAVATIGVSAGAEADLAPMAATYVLLLAVIGPLVSRFAR